MSYTLQWRIAVMAAMIQGMWIAMQAAGPQALGLPVVAMTWLGIIMAGIAIGSQFLPNLRRPPTNQGNEPLPPDIAEGITERYEYPSPNNPEVRVPRRSRKTPEPED